MGASGVEGEECVGADLAQLITIIKMYQYKQNEFR